MANIFLTAGILCALFGVGFSLVIVSFLSDRGVKINWLLLRLFLPKYVGMYKKITVEENGKPGVWFYCFVFSMVSALVLSVVGILIKTL